VATGYVEKLNALDHTHTWDLVPLPPRKISISYRWVYKIMTRADGLVECYKTRLVARGFTQNIVMIMRRVLLLLLR